MTEHVWEQGLLRKPDEHRRIMICKRCGTWTEMVLPGIPNLNGAVEVERDCDLVVVRKVMLS
jgi:hypothetical protein